MPGTRNWCVFENRNDFAEIVASFYLGCLLHSRGIRVLISKVFEVVRYPVPQMPIRRYVTYIYELRFLWALEDMLILWNCGYFLQTNVLLADIGFQAEGFLQMRLT